jgi:hypothetical protein
VKDLLQNQPYVLQPEKVNTRVLGIIIILTFTFFALSIIGIWVAFLPQMETAGEETSELISGEGAGTQIINIDIIPEVRFFLILSLVIFGILDGIFAFMLWRGKPNNENTAVITPLFATYLTGRIFSGLIMSFLPIPILVSTNPRFMMTILYLSAVVLVGLSLVIILIFQMKVFSESKRTATKILVGKSEDILP